MFLLITSLTLIFLLLHIFLILFVIYSVISRYLFKYHYTGDEILI